MPYALIVGGNRADNLGGPGGTSGDVDSSGGNLIVLAIATDAGVTLVPGDISDNKGNGPYTFVADYVGGGVDRIHLFYIVAPPTVGSAHKFTVSKASSFSSIAIATFSGAHATPFDQQAGNGVASGNIGANVTPAEDDCLIVSAVANGSTTPCGSPSGFTQTDQVGLGGGGYGVGLAYVVQTTAAFVSGVWTSGSGGVATVIASFKAAAGGGGTGKPAGYYARQRGA